MAAPSIPLATVEEYLEFDGNSETKHEYYRGQIIAMAGGGLNHSQIGGTVTALLWNATRNRHLSGHHGGL
jgi:Uma2 family endonuclease